MESISKTYFDSIVVNYKEEKYNLLSISDSKIIEDIFSRYKISPSNLNLFSINIFVERDAYNRVLFSVVISTKNNHIDCLKDKNDSVPLIFDGLEMVLVRQKRDYDFMPSPFYYSYEFEKVIFFSNGVFTDVSNVLEDLNSLDYSMFVDSKLVLMAEKEFNEILEKNNIIFDFNKVLSFEDFYDYKKNIRRISDGISRA